MKTELNKLKTATLVWMSIDKKFINQIDAIMNEICNRISFEKYESMKSRAQINEFLNR